MKLLQFKKYRACIYRKDSILTRSINVDISTFAIPKNEFKLKANDFLQCSHYNINIITLLKLINGALWIFAFLF